MAGVLLDESGEGGTGCVFVCICCLSPGVCGRTPLLASGDRSCAYDVGAAANLANDGGPWESVYLFPLCCTRGGGAARVPIGGSGRPRCLRVDEAPCSWNR